jgi:hypothetical protein
MANATILNTSTFSTSDLFSAVWTLSRALLAAGYKYKSSSDALAKDTTGDMTNDRWATGGLVNNSTVSGQTGSAASIGAPSNGVSQITGLTGMLATSVGHYLTISGAATSANNGTWRIVSRSSATQVGIYNPAAASDANNGSISWSEQQGGQAASIGAASAGRSTITGLTGMSVQTSTSRGSVGDRLTITNATTGANNGTFVIVQVLSATSVVIENASAVSDANNGSISWTEMSPTSQSFPTTIQGASGTGAWLSIQGPSTIRIPVGTAVPTGYVRGENLTQSSTGAQGELIGSCPDSVGGLGYIVIAPRVNGTGSAPRGWNISGGATDNITGGVSGTVFTPLSSGTAVEFVQELVFWKNTALNGHVYAQCVDSVGESTSRFSVQAALGTCTATVCPGGATGGVVTTNGFPTVGTMVLVGTGGSGAAGTGSTSLIANATITTGFGKIQAMVANAIEASGVSSDGSWTLAVGNPAGSGGSLTAYIGIVCQRLDDCEEGDVWPYVYGIPTTTFYTGTRTVNTTTVVSTTFGDMFSASVSWASSGASSWRGWRRRGFSVGDSFQEFQGAVLGAWNGNSIIGLTPATSDRVACALVTTVVREPVWVVSTQVNQRMRKGTCRWMNVTQGGSGNDTYDGKRWVQLSSSVSGSVAMGPWDGTNIPQNS